MRVPRVLTAAVVLLLVLLVPAAGDELDQHGKAHPWRGASDGYTIIDFAASWCAPCWKSLPELQSFAEELPALRVIVVSVDDERKGRDRLVDEIDLQLPVLWDENSAIAEHYEPPAMPSTFVLDPSGEVIYVMVGYNREEWQLFETFVRDLPLDSD